MMRTLDRPFLGFIQLRTLVERNPSSKTLPSCPPWRLHRRFSCEMSTADLASYKEVFARRMSMAGLKPHHRIALGVSGGPDSMALCVLAAGWKLDGMAGRDERSGFINGILGIVVDHRLRLESSDEAIMVQERVSKMGIECKIESCNWSDGKPKLGHLQEAARELRYEILQGVCIEQQIGVFLIAHHADDQAELFILRLSRNSGVLGLAGMAFASQLFPTHLPSHGESSENHGILLVRPLLELVKDDMYTICQRSHQEWVEDPTNRKDLFARNRIRVMLRSLSSGVFNSELQTFISACRSTRSFVENVCVNLIKKSVTIMSLGYAVIDLEKLHPSNVENLCLAKFLAVVLQFISQRHRPIRGRVMQLLLNYIRSIPCKTSLTAAGCFLSPAPRSKGMKVLVCCSLDSPQSSRMRSSYVYPYDKQQPSLAKDIDDMIRDARTYSDQSISEISSVLFLDATTSDAILSEAKMHNLISESTLTCIRSLQLEESINFNAKKEVEPDHGSRHEIGSACLSSILFQSGQSCHFMNRFLVTMEPCKGATEDCSSCVNDRFLDSEGNGDYVCVCCMDDQDGTTSVRHMVDSDWLYLAKLVRGQLLCQDCTQPSACDTQDAMTVRKNDFSSFTRLSAGIALEALKSIPASARRALPVLVNSHGVPLSIPSIGFRSCPYLSFHAVFKPRVPLGGGYSSYL